MKNEINDSFKYAIALTGGIATGKSTVTSLFMLHGFLTIDADKIAHKLLNIHSSSIAKLFGEEYVEEGKVLRKKLGFLIFNNSQEKEKLEKFIHPLIKDAIIDEAKIFESQKKPYLIDIPLFFENGAYDIQDSVVVYTPSETQLDRFMKRNNYSKEESLNRIASQMPIEEKKSRATWVIDNSKNLKHLQQEVEDFVEKIKKKYL